jgi:hypothetical protein
MSLLEDLTRVSKLPSFEGQDAVRHTNGNIRSSFGYTSWNTALLYRLNSGNEADVERLCRDADLGIYIIGGVCMSFHTPESTSDTRFEVYVKYTNRNEYEYRAVTYATGHSTGKAQAPADVGVSELKTTDINSAIKFLIDKVDSYDDTYVDKDTMKELIGSF